MALVSPGVQVSIIDESVYAPTAVGTVPYILIATAENKTQPGSSSLAVGTLAENADKVYNITSQRDLVTTFGAPNFENIDNVPVNGSELNEYGLMAAYSALAVCNSAYVQRANVDLAKLVGSTSRPVNDPTTGTYWLDTDASTWGVFEWNATTQRFVEKQVLRIFAATDIAESPEDETVSFLSADIISTVPASTTGEVGDYAIMELEEYHPIFYKTYDGTWVLVGSQGWQEKVPTASFTFTAPASSGNLWINGDNVSITSNSNISTVNSAINSASITGITSRVSGSSLILTATQEAGYDGDDGVLVINRTSGAVTSNAMMTMLGLSLTASDITYQAAVTAQSPYNQVPRWQSSALAKPSNSVWQKTSASGGGVSVNVKRYNALTEQWQSQTVTSWGTTLTATYGLDKTGGGKNIPQNTVVNLYAALENNSTEGNLPRLGGQLFRRRLAAGSSLVISSSATYANTAVVLDSGLVATSTFSMTFRASPSDANLTTVSGSITGSSFTVADFINAVNAVGNQVVYASFNSDGKITMTHKDGGEIQITDGTNLPFGSAGFGVASEDTYVSLEVANTFALSGWSALAQYNNNEGYSSQDTAPTVEPTNGTLWYNDSATRVDVLIKDGAGNWRNYRALANDYRGFDLTECDPEGPIISASAPTTQGDGETALAYGDLWVDTGDLDNFPMIYRWQIQDGADQWVLIDKTDSLSPAGIIFDDARWDQYGNINAATTVVPSITDLGSAAWETTNSNGEDTAYLDLDAPDPALYPEGILLFNTRASSYGVKEWRENYFSPANWPEIAADAGSDMNQDPNWQTGAWVNVSGVDSRGLPNFGRKAQRGFVVAKLQAAIDASDGLREESSVFNIIACPGYPELLDNMVALNTDREETAFVIGDAPLRLPATGTAVQAWATNTNSYDVVGQAGLTVASPYAAIYFPHAQTNDLSGNEIVVPASHVAIRNMIKSDNQSYPWFAPAGTRRGLVDNASAIGYIDSATGRFVSVGVTQGLRDTLYNNKINPLSVLPGAGLMVYGQKTLNPNPSALDRINVARLVNYVRRQLTIATRPFIFEPNDTITRNSVQTVVSGFLIDLVAKRGIYDFVVVCDDSNNTSSRIANNELWVDVAIQPIKAVEFIYIPIRLKNPGDLEV
jgi:hypothetical protein